MKLFAGSCSSRWLAPILGALLLPLVHPPAVSAQQSSVGYEGFVRGGSANLLDEQGACLATLPAGTPVDVVGGKGSLYQVKARPEGRALQGYVHKTSVAFHGPRPPEPDQKRGSLRKWVYIGGGAAVVAAGGVALAAGLSSGGGDSDGSSGPDYRRLSGTWQGHARFGNNRYASQTFNLTVSREGAIQGTLRDNVTGRNFFVTGQVNGDHVVMNSNYPDRYEGTLSGNAIRGTMVNLGGSNVGYRAPWSAYKS